ncbi:hypothetical protein WICPIJ_003820 [Wickerhamomyces pijperi]|uniref:Uncharacterized protein n=1 Tax=Wickerhamomyces pijperi TaxID=599730 RepID=A0A9P8Q761_WICPI|nr:hypothetical protein WICPIJ_003820 [Wickerhamomyces pijperi]
MLTSRSSLDFIPDELPYYDPSMTRKVALITGGNSGIGFYTVLHLYLHGFVVYIAGRSKSKVCGAIEKIKTEALRRRSNVIEGDLKTRFLGELHFLELDLLNLANVEKSTVVFKSLNEPVIDLMILNAGIGAIPYALTNDGFEIQFQTNFISNFLFTQRLLPLMNKEQGRIIYVSSIAHHLEIFKFSRDWTFNYKPNIIFTWLRYAMSKTSGIQYMKLLSMKHPELQCYSVHPGLVMNTNFFGYWTRIPFIGIFFWFFFQLFGWFFGCSNEEGSYATLRCALSNEEFVNGSYFVSGGKLASSSKVSSDLNAATNTWIWTTKELEKKGFTDLE